MSKVLIVEDDQLQAMAFARMLRAKGIEVVTSPDAIGAIRTANLERPDAIVLDLGLPAGGGLLVLQRLRNLVVTAVTPVIVATGGMIDDATAKRLAECGVETILTKPVSETQLVAAVGSALGLDASTTGELS